MWNIGIVHRQEGDKGNRQGGEQEVEERLGGCERDKARWRGEERRRGRGGEKKGEQESGEIEERRAESEREKIERQEGLPGTTTESSVPEKSHTLKMLLIDYNILIRSTYLEDCMLFGLSIEPVL